MAKASKPEAMPAKRKSYAAKDMLRIVLAMVPLLVVGWWLNHRFGISSIRSTADLQQVTQEIRTTLHPEEGVLRKLVSYLIFTFGALIISMVGIPRWMICAIAGMVYGAALGVGLATVGTVAGAVASYYLGASLLKSTVQRRLGKRFKKLYDAFRRDGFGYTLHLRLMPGTPGLLTNLMAGAFRVRLRDYVLATAIGYFPATVMFALLGSGAIKSNAWQLSMAVGLYVAFSVGHYLWLRGRKARQEADGDE